MRRSAHPLLPMSARAQGKQTTANEGAHFATCVPHIGPEGHAFRADQARQSAALYCSTALHRPGGEVALSHRGGNRRWLGRYAAAGPPPRPKRSARRPCQCRLCSHAGITSRHARKRGKKRRPFAGARRPRGPCLHAHGANRLWLTDLTEHPTREGTLYLCAVKEAWSRRIVGYAIDQRMTSQLAVDALRMAVIRRGGVDRFGHPGCCPSAQPRSVSRGTR